MNIAIVTSEFISESNFDGGLANYTYKLAKWLISKGHKATVFLKSNESSTMLFDGIEVVKVKHKDFSSFFEHYSNRLKIDFLFPDKMKYNIEFRQSAYLINRRIKKEHKKNKIDIIHYPNLGGYAYYRLKNIPSIVRLSGSVAIAQKMGGYGISDLKIYMQAKFEYRAMKRADAVFGPSKMMATLTEQLIGKKIEIIETPYMVPEGELDNSIYEQYLRGKRYVLFFGSIGLIKGVGTIAEIIYPLLKQHQDLYYVFVGKKLNNSINGRSVWDYLLDKTGEFSNRLIYIPSQKHSTLFPIIQHAEFITLPSRIDNFPNTCIESMANKKIVIGTKGNGFDQLITDGENGFLVDVDDSQALLDKINYVLKLDSGIKKQIEQKALERADKLHPDIVLNQLMDLYLETIDKHKNGKK